MASVFQKKLATTSQEQFERFHLFRENQEPLTSQIRRYWTELGFSFPGIDVHWSAVFVSWCVKQSGASKDQFKFAQAHSKFVHQAIKNAEAGTGVFRGRQVSSYSPKVGDILQNNRGGGTVNFEFARTHSSYKSHSAVVFEVGADNRGQYLRTIGGNESDSVGMKEVRLDAGGRVKNPDGLYICAIETLL